MAISFSWRPFARGRGLLGKPFDAVASGKLGAGAELGFDGEETVGNGAGATFAQVQGIEPHAIVGNVIAFAAAVTGHDPIARVIGHLHRFKGLGDGADLIDLEQHGIGRARCQPLL